MKNLDFKAAELHLKKDKKLARAIELIELPPRNPSKNVYEGLIRSIVSQQLSVKAAATIYGRFIALFPEGKADPSQLIAKETEDLRGVGLSYQKCNYVQNVASFFIEKQLFDSDWDQYSDEEIIILLTEIKGVGKWTVQMILMFVLGRPDVMPVLDLGIQNGMKKIYKLKQEKKELHQKMEKMSLKWRPHRTVACLYLWAVNDVEF